jgi:hypothetical protein
MRDSHEQAIKRTYIHFYGLRTQKRKIRLLIKLKRVPPSLTLVMMDSDSRWPGRRKGVGSLGPDGLPVKPIIASRHPSTGGAAANSNIAAGDLASTDSRHATFRKVTLQFEISVKRNARYAPRENSLPTGNEKASSRMRALRRAPITFLSREVHSGIFVKQRTIVSQIPAMKLGSVLNRNGK